MSLTNTSKLAVHITTTSKDSKHVIDQLVQDLAIVDKLIFDKACASRVSGRCQNGSNEKAHYISESFDQMDLVSLSQQKVSMCIQEIKQQWGPA